MREGFRVAGPGFEFVRLGRAVNGYDGILKPVGLKLWSLPICHRCGWEHHHELTVSW